MENIDQRPARSSAGLKLSVAFNQWLGICQQGEKVVASSGAGWWIEGGAKEGCPF